MLIEFEEICDLTKPKNSKDGRGVVEPEPEQTTIEEEHGAKMVSIPQAS